MSANCYAASATTPAPKLVGDTLRIHTDYTRVNVGSSVYFSGRLTNDYGYGLGGYTAYLTDNGYYISNSNFYTYADGTWGRWLTFHSVGSHDIAVHCDGLNAMVEVQVY
jgi:hypothetical protein